MKITVEDSFLRMLGAGAHPHKAGDPRRIVEPVGVSKSNHQERIYLRIDGTSIARKVLAQGGGIHQTSGVLRQLAPEAVAPWRR